MVKFIIYCIKVISVAFAALLLNSCNQNIGFGKSITGSGNVIKEERKLSSFEKVTVCCGLECEIQQSDQFKVIVEADDNVIKEIKTTVENGTLIISSDFSNYINVSSKKVIVFMPNIKHLETTSGSSLNSLNLLTSSKILLKSSSGSEMNVTIESDTISLESTSGSEQNIKGKALVLNTSSSSGSSIKAKELLANEIFSQSTSGSSTEIYPIIKLNAKASSGSSIEYKNKPKNISIEESSGGNVSN